MLHTKFNQFEWSHHFRRNPQFNQNLLPTDLQWGRISIRLQNIGHMILDIFAMSPSMPFRSRISTKSLGVILNFLLNKLTSSDPANHSDQRNSQETLHKAANKAATPPPREWPVISTSGRCGERTRVVWHSGREQNQHN